MTSWSTRIVCLPFKPFWEIGYYRKIFVVQVPSPVTKLYLIWYFSPRLETLVFMISSVFGDRSQVGNFFIVFETISVFCSLQLSYRNDTRRNLVRVLHIFGNFIICQFQTLIFLISFVFQRKQDSFWINPRANRTAYAGGDRSKVK